MTVLASVPTNQPEPPYPADTQAGGVVLDLDVHRLMASDTWALLKPEIRPWWLMLFVVGWAQAPCGAFKNDHRTIAAKIGATEDFVKVHHADLLRGWYPCTDGRLYHKVLTEKVMDFLAVRAKWRLKRNQQRKPNVSGDTPGTPRGQSEGANKPNVPGDSPQCPPHVHPMSAPSSSSSSSSSPSFSPSSSTKKEEEDLSEGGFFSLGGGTRDARDTREESEAKTTQSESRPKATEKKISRSGRFAPPTLEDVKKYAAEKGFSINAEKFVAHYEAGNWMRGKTKITNWKACVRTWMQNDFGENKPTRAKRQSL